MKSGPKSKLHEWIGKRIGRYVITDVCVIDREAYAYAKCDCGVEKRVHMGGLKRTARGQKGGVVSCGCYNIERAKKTKNNLIHGKSHTPTYNSWISARRRCDPAVGITRYGMRGIKMCDRWKNSFFDFVADMGERPSKEYSLDRINNDGNYEPGNCRWVTRRDQNRNKCVNVIIEIHGNKMCMLDFAEYCGCTIWRVRYQMYVKHLSPLAIYEMVTTKKVTKSRTPKYHSL